MITLKDRLVYYSRSIVEIADDITYKGGSPKEGEPVELHDGWNWIHADLFNKANEDGTFQVVLSARDSQNGHIFVSRKNNDTSNLFPYDFQIPLHYVPEVYAEPLMNLMKGATVEGTESELAEVAVYLSSLAHSLEILSFWEIDIHEEKQTEGLSHLERDIANNPVVVRVESRVAQGKYGFIKLSESQVDTLCRHKVFENLSRTELIKLLDLVRKGERFIIQRENIQGLESPKSLDTIRIVPCEFKAKGDSFEVIRAKTKPQFNKDLRYSA